MGDTVYKLWADYVYYWGQTLSIQKLKKRIPHCKDLVLNKKRTELFYDMIDWCSENEVQADRWLYSLFAARHWLHAPKLEVAHLMSKKQLAKFPNFRDYAGYTQYRAMQMSKKKEFDPRWEISVSVEQAKGAYLRAKRSDLCMSSMQDETFGFHPLSEVCSSCDRAMVCAASVFQVTDGVYDIMALRNGDIKSDGLPPWRRSRD